MNDSECFAGSYVVHPDFGLDRVVTLRRNGRPAFVDPPLVGVVEYLIPNTQDREANVYWPGIGNRRMAVCELEAAEHWLIDHTADSAKWQRNANGRERNLNRVSGFTERERRAP